MPCQWELFWHVWECKTTPCPRPRYIDLNTWVPDRLKMGRTPPTHNHPSMAHSRTCRPLSISSKIPEERRPEAEDLPSRRWLLNCRPFRRGPKLTTPHHSAMYSNLWCN